ncbi:unnamed protein product, partial [Ixodes persulcatus]
MPELVHVVPDELVGGPEALQVPLHEREHLELALPVARRVGHRQVVAQVAAQFANNAHFGRPAACSLDDPLHGEIDGRLLPVEAVVVLHAHHHLIV